MNIWDAFKPVNDDFSKAFFFQKPQRTPCILKSLRLLQREFKYVSSLFQAAISNNLFFNKLTRFETRNIIVIKLSRVPYAIFMRHCSVIMIFPDDGDVKLLE